MPSTTIGTISVTVPAITDPDLNSVDVTLPTGSCAVGDHVIATPIAALEATCLCLGAYVTAANVVRVVFGSVGGNVVGSAKNFKFYIIYS